ncbi:MAG TPA: winged helix-turn-helix transcriptional regulator [Longimicrobium sp.]
MRNPLGTLLDPVLGSEAAVRILRELCAAGAPLNRAEIARRSGLSLPGVGSALQRLHTAGVVELVGGGARQSVQMRPQHPLVAHLVMLFFAERVHGEAVLERLRRAVASVKPAPIAAWINTQSAPSPAVLTVLAGARDVPATREQLRRPLTDVQSELDIAIEVRVITEADGATAAEEIADAWKHATPVYGTGPAGAAAVSPRTRGGRTHQSRDASALRRGVWIARQLERDPTLVKRARQWLVKRIPEVCPQEEHELQEWLDVLNGSSVPRIQHVLSDPGERGRRLRQSNPFIHALTERERTQMRREISA